MNLNYEHYLRGDSEWDPDYDYWRTYIEAPPLGAWALSAGQDGGFGVRVAADFRAQHSQEYPSNNLFRSEEDNPLAVENFFISEGYFAGRYDGLLLQLGRSPVHFGAAGFSSALPSERLPYLDTLYYTWKLGPLKMTSYFGTLYNGAGGSEIDAMAGLPNIDDPSNDGVIKYNGPEPGTHQVAFDKTIILNTMHRFEWAFPKVRLGISAHNVISRENNALHIGDIFPVFSWHNAQVGVHNLSLVAEMEYTPISGLVLFGQAGYDDVNAEDISGVGDTDIPTIYAYILGTNYETDTRSGRLGLNLEGGVTHYLWGNFHEFDPDRGNYLSRAIYRYLRDEEMILLPLTSPYGPGSRWLKGSCNYKWSEIGIIAGLNFEVISHNSAASLVSTAYKADEAVSEADRELWGRLGLRFEYTDTVNTMHGYSVYVEPAYCLRDSGGWAELTVGGKLDLLHRGVITK